MKSKIQWGFIALATITILLCISILWMFSQLIVIQF